MSKGNFGSGVGQRISSGFRGKRAGSTQTRIEIGYVCMLLNEESHRALTSITQYSLALGLRAYWMLHSPTTPRWRMTLMAALRSMWYSSSGSVCDGATTIESPVCVPRGSKFSILQQIIVFYGCFVKWIRGLTKLCTHVGTITNNLIF